MRFAMALNQSKWCAEKSSMSSKKVRIRAAKLKTFEASHQHSKLSELGQHPLPFRIFVQPHALRVKLLDEVVYTPPL